ncbi:amidohydrolase [uncultured Aurantimicrobium sp.]|uniref:amidohydrolase n=1 Tax=uncultured Aurantimicrobium sp. TaxID=1705357 RepID=UPI0026256AE8|nr:amidohydrolase [uncultured Aurantimicrobium sp.]
MTIFHDASADDTTVFHGGVVWLEPHKTTSALAITGGTISALGEEALALLDQASHTVDLAGRFLMPAFSDGHCHPVFAGLEYQGPAITGKKSIDAIVEAVRVFAEANPDAEWIRGGSYDPTLAEGGNFDAAWLDAVVSDRPVILRAADYHTLWCNSEALKRAHVTTDTPEPRLGRIERRPDGSPLGTLREWHACDLMLDVAPPTDPEALVTAVVKSCEVANSNGITWMQDAWVDLNGHRPFITALERNQLTVRTNLAFRADPDHWRQQADDFIRMRAEVHAAGNEHLLTARTVKFFVDGVVESATAEMIAPYLDTHEHGMPNWSREELLLAVAHFDALGFQTHLHAIGDRAVRHALDSIENATEVNETWDRRSTITHVQVVHPDDLPRFAELGVIANFQAHWAQEDDLMTKLTAPRLGPERTNLQYPVGSLWRSGARLSFGSDWPVSPNNFVETMLVAATRQTDDGSPAEGWVPEQRITVDDGLLIATAGTAYQSYTEKFRGTIAVGMAADLVVLDRDVTSVEPMVARKAVASETYLSGVKVFTR